MRAEIEAFLQSRPRHNVIDCQHQPLLSPVVDTPQDWLIILPMAAKMTAEAPRILLLVLRRDLRLADNPLLHALRNTNNKHTHVLPVYIFNPQQIEVSGFLELDAKSPYPEARSRVGGFWRCGPHRARFVAECVWDLKESLGKMGSDLVVRVGLGREVVAAMLQQIGARDADGAGKVVGVWMTRDHGNEEMSEERGVRRSVEAVGEGAIEFRVFENESYLIHRYGISSPGPSKMSAHP